MTWFSEDLRNEIYQHGKISCKMNLYFYWKKLKKFDVTPANSFRSSKTKTKEKIIICDP